MATVFEQISLDIQAHYLAWTGELDELRKKETLTPEEKALLENRVHPIFKETSTAIGAFINGLDIAVKQALDAVSSKPGRLSFDQHFKNVIQDSGKTLSQSLDNLLGSLKQLHSLKSVLSSKLLLNSLENFSKAIPGNLGKIFGVLMGMATGLSDDLTGDDKTAEQQTKDVITNLLGVGFGVAGTAVVSFAAASVGIAASPGIFAIAVGVAVGLAMDFVWEYVIPQEWKDAASDAVYKVYNAISEWADKAWGSDDNLSITKYQGDGGVDGSNIDENNRQYLVNPQTGETIDVQNDNAAVKMNSEEALKKAYQDIIDAEAIHYITEDGKTYAIVDGNTSLVIRNNLDKIASESFVISNVLLNSGDKINFGDGRDYYEVKSGDTLYTIAHDNQMTVKQLVEANPWLLDEGRITFYKNHLLLEKGDTLDIDNTTKHGYGGGSGNDYLADFNGGDDIYRVSGGEDIMEDKSGYDTYYADDFDTIMDKDGKGEVFLNDRENKLAGGEHNSETDPANIYYGDGLTYYWAGGDLIVNNGLQISDFKNGDLGIRLTKRDGGGDGGGPNTRPAELNPSPIIIDLNGDGVQTTPKGGHVYHDHDGNGFAENTGWASAEDALLVRDLNNNNQIDNGGELFGDNTLLPNGTRAANGFEALKAHDANGDKQITEQDAIWQELKLWQDKNQNGYADAGELTAIQNSGITAIQLNYKNSSFVDAHGNAHKQQSSVTWADGKQTAAHDVWFSVNKTDSQYRHESVSADVAALPYVRGFGDVLNLHQAMMKDAVLKGMVADYLNAPTAESLSALIYHWTRSESVDPQGRGDNIDARQLVALEHLTGRDFYQHGWRNPGEVASQLLKAEFTLFADYVSANLLAQGKYADAFDSLLLEQWQADTQSVGYSWQAFNAKLQGLAENSETETIGILLKVARDLGNYSPNYQEMFFANFVLLATQNILLGNMMVENFKIIEGNVYNNRLEGSALGDIYLFSKGHRQNTISDNGNGDDIIYFKNISFNEVRLQKNGNSLLIYGNNDNDSVCIQNFFSNINYQIETFIFKDQTFTADTLISNKLYGDRFYGSSGSDTLIGGAGIADHLDGGKGADTYLFSRGHGQDTVCNYSDGVADNDTIQFTDVNYSEIRWHQNDYDLLLINQQSGDSVRIQDFFNNRYQSGYYEIETFIFQDQTFTLAQMREMGLNFYGTDGNDNLNFSTWQGNAHIYGGLGSDTIQAATKGNLLDGGEGNDRLSGNSGADTLIGGSGNDHLSGGYGSDTYLFSKGHGQDTVYDYEYSSTVSIDTIQFTDVNYGETRWQKNGYDLMITNPQSGDSIWIQRFFLSKHYEIETFVFQDQTFTPAQIREMGLNLHGTDGDDNINLSEWQGKVNIDGGLGNDYLEGNNYSNTYLFSKGHGQDTVYDYSYGIVSNDTIQFTDISYSETRWHQDSYDLIIANQQSGDSVRVQDFFRSSNYEIETFIFQDQTFTLAQMGLNLYGTDGDDGISLSYSWQYKANIYGWATTPLEQLMQMIYWMAARATIF
ncbi:calcium-binding protein [Stenoxybacter acetivorans]|uniref:calcium-binding protein n=1 Tax=Stenoxybacter acetivorans TaxID=422441 RepID=UPI000568B3A6|nr:calcium-binding protein [Stenoxybacter acetivorans]